MIALLVACLSHGPKPAAIPDSLRHDLGDPVEDRVHDGVWATSITGSQLTFVTAEHTESEHASGALRIALRTDGSALGCFAADTSQRGETGPLETSDGKFHASETRSAQAAIGMIGTWSPTGIDLALGGPCDAPDRSGPAVALRCVGVGTTRTLGGPAIACTSEDLGPLRPLGVPIADPLRRREDAPRWLVLGRDPGVAITWDWGGQDPAAKVTAKPGARAP